MFHRSLLFLTRLVMTPARRPRTAIALAVLVTALAIVSSMRLEPVPSLKPMFGEDDPAARAMATLLEKFSAADQLLLLVSADEPAAGTDQRAADAQNRPARARLLAFAERLDARIQRDEALAEMVNTVTYESRRLGERFLRQEALPAGLYYLDQTRFQKLADRLTGQRIQAQIQRNEALLTAASPTADAISQRILEDPLRLHEFLLDARAASQAGVEAEEGRRFVSASGRHLLIRINAHRAAGELDFTRTFMKRMRGAVRQAEPGSLKVAYAGAYPTAELSADTIRRDMIQSVIVSIVVLQILFLLAYRRPWYFALAFIPVAAGIQLGFGIFACYTTRLTPVTAAAGAILAGLGIDYCIHYLSHYQDRRARQSPGAAARAGLRLAPALLAACVTSLIGFATIAGSSVPGLRDFALIGTLGLAGAFLGALWLLPALLSVFDRRTSADPLAARFHLRPLLRRIGRRPIAWALGPLLLFGLALLALVLKGPATFDADMSAMNPKPSPPMKAQARIERLFPGSLDTVQLHLQADSPRQLLIRAHQADARLTEAPLRELGVGSTLSIARLLPDPRRLEARQKRIDRLDPERIISDFRQAVRESRFSLEACQEYIQFLQRFLRPGNPPEVTTLQQYPQVARLMLPRDAVGADRPPPTQALSLVRFSESPADQANRETIRKALADRAQALAGVTVTGMDLVARDVGRTLRREVPMLLTLAAALVGVWLWIVFRSFPQAALTLVPAIFCLVTLLAVIRLTGISLNLVNMIALPMLIGIGVDDGIFLVSIARRHRRQPRALGEALAASCHAITMTTLTTTLAFGSLIWTQVPAIRSLGLVLTIGMIGCWIGAILLLAPVLLRKTPAPSASRQSAPPTLASGQ